MILKILKLVGKNLIASSFASLSIVFFLATNSIASQGPSCSAFYQLGLASSPRQGIIASTDSPTHMVFTMMDLDYKKLVLSAISAMNTDVAPVIVYRKKFENQYKKLKTQIRKLNPKSIFIPISSEPGASEFATYSNWARDYMPELVRKDKEKYFAGFRYNRGDMMATSVQKAVAEKLGIPLKKINLVMELGAYRVGPDGVLYVSKDVIETNSEKGIEKLKLVVDADWAPEMPLLPRTTAEIETLLKSELNVKELVWIEMPPKLVEGTGHADMYIQFLKPDAKIVQVVRARAIEDASENFINAVNVANLAFDSTAHIFESRGYKVIRPDAIATPGVLYSTTNSVFDGKRFLTSNIDFRSQEGIYYNIDQTYAQWGIPAYTVGFFTLSKSGGFHCLTRQYNLNK